MATSGKKNGKNSKARETGETRDISKPQDDGNKREPTSSEQDAASHVSDKVDASAASEDIESSNTKKTTKSSKPRPRRKSTSEPKKMTDGKTADNGKPVDADKNRQDKADTDETEETGTVNPSQKAKRSTRSRKSSKAAQKPSDATAGKVANSEQANDIENKTTIPPSDASEDASPLSTDSPSASAKYGTAGRRRSTQTRTTRAAARRTKATNTSEPSTQLAAKSEADGHETQGISSSPLLRFSCPIDMSDRVVVRARALGIDMTQPTGAETLQKLLDYANRFTELPDGKPGRRLRHFVREYDGFLGPNRTIPIDMLDEIDLAAFSMAMNLDMGDVNLLQYDTGEWVASPFDTPWPQNMLDAMQAMSGYPPMRMQLAMTLAPNGVPQLDDKPCIGVSSVIVKNHEGRVRERIEKLAYTMDPSLADDAYDQFRAEMLFGEAAALMQRAAMELARPDQVDGKTENVVTIDDMPDTLLGTVLLRDARNGNDKLRGDAVVIGNAPESKHLMGRWLIRTVSPYMMRSNAPDGEGINVIRYFAYDDRDERGAMLRRLRKPSKVGNPADGSVVEVAMFEREENATDGNGVPIWRLMLAFNRRPDRLEALDEMLNGQSQVPIGGLVVVD